GPRACRRRSGKRSPRRLRKNAGESKRVCLQASRGAPGRGWCHFPFALEPLVFAGGGPAASLASRSAFRRSRLLVKAFCAISCSVIAFLASTWRNALRASRSALVVGFGGWRAARGFVFFLFFSRISFPLYL